MRSFPFFILFLFIISGCGKSSIEPSINPPAISLSEQIKATYGIIIDENTLVHSYIAPGTYEHMVENTIAFSGVKNNLPWAGIYDLITKELIAEFKFKNYERDLGHGNFERLYFAGFALQAITKTHVYGYALYADQNKNMKDPVFSNRYNGAVYFSGKISTNEVDEYDLRSYLNFDSANDMYRLLNLNRQWYNNSFISISSGLPETISYKIIGDNNQVILEFTDVPTFTDLNFIKFPVSYSQSIYASKYIYIFDLETGTSSSIPTLIGENDDDSIEIMTVHSVNNIATVKVKITTNEGVITEKTIQVDVNNLKIII